MHVNNGLIVSELSYFEARDLAFCHVCMTAQRDGRLSSSTVDKAFIVTGFSNWKDATIRFKNHESSGCHREAMERAITLPKVTKDIGELLSEASSSRGTARFGRTTF